MSAAATTSRQTHAIVLALALAAAGLSLLASSKYGPQVTADSVAYLTAAKSLVAEGRYDSYDRPFYRWPPLYPTLLAAAPVAGVDAVAWARFLNAAALAGIVLAAWALIRRIVSDTRLALAATGAVAISSPLHVAAASVWSEPLFILFALLFLLALVRFLATPRAGWLLLVSLLAACAVMQRYAGVTVLATGGIAILLLPYRSSPAKRLAHAAAFSVFSTLPLLIWIKRNFGLSGTPIGGRGPSSFSAIEVLRFFFETTLGWYVPRSLLPPPVLLLTVVSGIALAIWLVVLWRRKRPGESPISPAVWPAALFAAVYSAFTIGTSIVFSYDRVTSRILVPLAVFVAFGGFLAIHAVAVLTGGSAPAVRGRALRRPLLALMLAFLFAFPVVRLWQFTAAALTDGAGGYNAKRWRESEATAWLRASPASDRLHSNAPAAVLFLTGRPARWSPRGPVDTLPGPTLDVLWYRGASNRHLYTPREFEDYYHVEVVRRFADATLYSLSRRE